MKVTKSILIVFCFFILKTNGQSADTLHVYDVHAIIITPPQSFTVGSSMSVNSFTMVVYFSIDKPDSTSSINVLIGNSAGSGSLRNQQFNVVTHNTTQCMHHGITNAEISPFRSNSTKCEFVFSQIEFTQLKYVTVKATHHNSNVSQNAYFKIQ
jgi:hypothetical protein